MSPRTRRALLRWHREGGARPQLHLVGIDDGPFDRRKRGDVLVVGAVYRGGEVFDGMMTTRVRRDGRNATSRLVEMLNGSRYRPQLHAVLLDGITLGGFNVIDLQRLNEEVGLPALVVVRHRPDLDAVRRALLALPGGAAKWALVERAGAVERLGEVWVQRRGLSREEAAALLELTCTRSSLPEPIRAAHIVAGAVVTGDGGRRP